MRIQVLLEEDCIGSKKKRETCYIQFEIRTYQVNMFDNSNQNNTLVGQTDNCMHRAGCNQSHKRMEVFVSGS